jgi:hypothetical protein
MSILNLGWDMKACSDCMIRIYNYVFLLQIIEKERKALEERSPAISQAKRRRQMIASLPKLFNMIHFLFQSIKRSVITKEELMHKIIASHCDIVDRSKHLYYADIIPFSLGAFGDPVHLCLQEKLKSS